MKTVFNQEVVNQLIGRLEKLAPNDKAQWGKMNAYQMLKHCTITEEMFQGKKVYKRLFVGKLFGKMALKGILKNEQEMKHSQPTHPEFKITSSGDFEAEKQKWIQLLRNYPDYNIPGIIHPFFGKMTKEEVGLYVFKHTDHHLRQFNH